MADYEFTIEDIRHGKDFEGGGSFTEQPKLTAKDAAYIRVAKDVIRSCDMFNDAFQMFNLPGEFDASKIAQHVDHWETGLEIDAFRKQAYEPVISNKFKGVFSAEHIVTITTVCARYFHETHRDILIYGPCQGAKTMVFCGSFLILPVLEHLYRRVLAVPVINVPNYKNMSLATERELKVINDLYSSVVFRHNDETLHLGYVQDHILNGVLEMELGLGSGTKTWNPLVLQRNTSNIVDFACMAAKSDEAKAVVTINFGDEIHFGSGRLGVADRLEGEWVRKNNDKDITMRRVGITATWSELAGVPHWMKIPLWTPTYYRGITKYNKLELPTLSTERPPIQEFQSIEESFPHFMEHLNLNRFVELEAFYPTSKAFQEYGGRPFVTLRHHEQMQVQTEHMHYQYEFTKAFYQIYKSCVSKEFPIMFARPFSTTAPCRLLLSMLESLAAEYDEKEEYTILRYFDPSLPDVFGHNSKKTQPRTLKEVLIDEYVNAVGPQRFCLVMAAKGRSRMGDSYPRQCKYYLDLVESSWSWNAMQQSTTGRSQGMHKESVCLFRKSYCDEVLGFIKNDCYDESKNFGSRDRYSHQHERRGRPNEYQIVLFREP